MKRKASLKRDFPRVFQKKIYTCGPACMRAILRYYGKRVSESLLEGVLGTNPDWGTTEERLISVAKHLGIYLTHGENFPYSRLVRFVSAGHPVIATFVHPDDDESHYAVVVEATSKIIRMRDPDDKKDLVVTRAEFEKFWYGRYHGKKRFALVFKRL